MFEYYIDFKIKDPQTSYFINRLFTKIHGFMTKNRSFFAMDLPSASEISSGDILRIFSDAVSIDKITNDPRINMYIKNKVIETTYLVQIPKKITQFVILKRNRFAEKVTYPKNKKKPFHINYENNSNGKVFSLYLDRTIVDKHKEGEFTSFGTSKDSSTVPYLE